MVRLCQATLRDGEARLRKAMLGRCEVMFRKSMVVLCAAGFCYCIARCSLVGVKCSEAKLRPGNAGRGIVRVMPCRVTCRYGRVEWCRVP